MTIKSEKQFVTCVATEILEFMNGYLFDEKENSIDAYRLKNDFKPGFVLKEVIPSNYNYEEIWKTNFIKKALSLILQEKSSLNLIEINYFDKQLINKYGLSPEELIILKEYYRIVKSPNNRLDIHKAKKTALKELAERLNKTETYCQNLLICAKKKIELDPMLSYVFSDSETFELNKSELLILKVNFEIWDSLAEKEYQKKLLKSLGFTNQGKNYDLKNALRKLKLNPVLSGLLGEYASNPDLFQKLRSILTTIQFNTFDYIYPTFYSFFSEYTKEEIDSVKENLAENTKNFINDTTDFSIILNRIAMISNTNLRNTTKRNFTYKLYLCIEEVYYLLVEKYGRRKIIPITPITNLPNRRTLNKRYTNLYKYFSKYNEVQITQAIATLSEANRKLLHQIFGNNLRRELTFKEKMQLNFNADIAASYEKIKALINTHLSSGIKTPPSTNKLAEEKYISSKIIRESPIVKLGIISVIKKNFFLDELAILAKVFNKNSKNDNYEVVLSNLSSEEQTIYHFIISKIKQKINIFKYEAIEFYNRLISTFTIDGYSKKKVTTILESPEVLKILAIYFEEENEQTKEHIKSELETYCWQMLIKRYGVSKKNTDSAVLYCKKTLNRT